MTESTESIATPHSHTRLIRNAAVGAKIEVEVSFTESPDSGEAPSVIVRCDACNKRLYDVIVGRIQKSGHALLVEDGTLVVKRKCPNCRGLNTGRVTSSEGRPLKRSDALDGPWRCIYCNWSLGKIDSVRSRITTRCRCGQESRVFAVDAIMNAYL